MIFGRLLAWGAYFYACFTCRGLTFIRANCCEVALIRRQPAISIQTTTRAIFLLKTCFLSPRGTENVFK